MDKSHKIILVSALLLFSIVLLPSIVHASLNVTVNSPSNNTWTNNNTLVVNYTAISSQNASDIKCNVIRVSDGVWIGNSNATSNNTATIITANSTSSDGTGISFNVTCQDADAGNNTGIFVINIDTVVPDVKVNLSTANATWYNTTTPSLFFNVTDRSSNTSCTLYTARSPSSPSTGRAINATVLNLTNTTFSWNSSETDGSILGAVNCTDQAGNINRSAWFNISIDTTAPTVTIYTPANLTWSNSSNVTVNFTVSDFASTTVCNATVSSTDYGSNSSVTNNTATGINITALVNDTNTSLLSVRCQDSAGNSGHAGNITLYIDNNTPSVSFLSPENGSSVLQSSGSFSLTYTFIERFLSQCFYSIDGLATVQISNCANSTISTLELQQPGLHNVTFFLNDSSGKFINATVNWTWVQPGTTASGGGGGGGGATTGQASLGIFTQTVGVVPKNTLEKIPISDGSLRITSVTVFTTSQINSYGVTVQRLDNLPIGLSPVSGKLHQYVEITVNADPSQYTTPSVTFRVPKTFLTDNQLNEYQIVLYRWHGEKWNSQETSYVSSDTDYAYYKSTLQGFSTFAIASGSQSLIQSTDSSSEPAGVVNQITGEATNIGNTPTNIGGYQMPLWLLGIILVFIIGIVVWLVKKR